MLAIFNKAFANPPEELHSPVSGRGAPKRPDEILGSFHGSHGGLSATFSRGGGGAALAWAGGRRRVRFCSLDGMYCVFAGQLENLCSLIRDYGLCHRSTDEALLVIEAYRTLRDRGPYPADQVLKALAGSFAFVLYDNRDGTVFAALSSDGGVPLFWGLAADGSVVICDDVEIIKGSCGKSFAPFPTGCMFHSEGGLRSFEHPMHRMKAMPRVDSEGVMCGAYFKVDSYSRINSIPRAGSAANWAAWDESSSRS